MSDPGDVQAVVARMQSISAEVPPGDGVGVFNRVYLRVTEMVLDRLQEGGVFHDDAFMADLDVRFADLWFDAYDAPAGKVPKAWDPLFDARAARGVLPVQFALAGVNAHIEHDLPLAVVRTCEANGRTPTSPGVRDDYEKVNDLLASVEADIRRAFFTDIEREIDDRLGPIVHLVSSWNIDKARDLAWVNVCLLWELRRSSFLKDLHLSALARTVGLGSRLLLAPAVL